MRKFLGEEFYTLYRASLEMLLKIIPVIWGALAFLSGMIQMEWAEEIIIFQVVGLMMRSLIIGAIQGWLGTFIFVTLVFVLMKVLNVPTDIINGQIIKNLMNVLYIGRDEAGFHFSMKDTLSLGLSPEGKAIINGPQGITGTPHDASFTIGILLILLTLFIVLNLIHSRDGRAIMAIRDNRIAAESIGIHVTRYKLMAFTLSASIAGVAGVLYGHNLSTLTALPKNFGYNMSIMILVFVVLGGIGNIRGSVISAVVLTLLPELLRGLSDYRMLIYAIVLIAMMLFNWSPRAVEFRERYSLKRLFGMWRNPEKQADR